MPYKPTGKPPGRPRREVLDAVPFAPEPAVEPAKVLSRARDGFRRAAADFSAALHSPPRSGPRRVRHVGKRPILHPNVIAKA
jgi:hypothetical protein